MRELERHLRGDRVRLVDVGARDGVDPRWERFAPVLEVVAFEPDESECDRLNHEAASLAYPARFLPHALWRERAEDVPFHVAAWPVASSIYPPNDEFLAPYTEARALLATREVRSIATTTLDQVAAERDFGCDVLKLDVEGAELDILRGGDVVLAGALALEVEVEFNPLFARQPLFGEVDHHLRERGWVLHGLRRTSWRRAAALRPADSGAGGQIVSADALYLGPGTGGELESGREVKLLVILAAYGQHDLVLDRLRRSASLDPAERDQLESELVPPGSAGERSQPGDATAWQDSDFF
jgi:FkbM family methyltransferase